MFTRPFFEPDRAASLAFVDARGFGVFCAYDGGKPVASSLAVNGADAYVSPHWYASPDQVPTWLYQAVHLSGPVRTMTGQQLADHLDALSARFESWLAPKPPWTTSEVTAGRREAMMQAIVGLVMTVEEIEGSFKLNQHKSDVDHAAVTDALALQADAGAQQLARTMRAMRPLAFINEAVQLEGSV